MDTDIRPQDDLFGHVNGRWLAETEIPSDRSSWGPFVQLADICEQQVRDIIEPRLARRAPTVRPTRPIDETPARSPTSTTPSWTPSGSRPWASARSAPCSTPRPRCATCATWRRSSASSSGSAATASSVLRRHRRPQLRPLPLPPRPGRPRAARRELLPRRQVRRDPRGLRRLPRHAAHPRRARRPRGRGPADPRPRHRAGQGTLGAGRDPRRPEDLQPAHRRRAQGDVPGVRLGRLRHQPRRAPDGEHATIAEVCVRQPSYLEHLSTVLDRDADRDLAGMDVQPGAAVGGAVPPRRLRRDQLRLLRPHPVRHARAARPLEARGVASSRARWARPSARSTSPGTSRPSRRR